MELLKNWEKSLREGSGVDWPCGLLWLFVLMRSVGHVDWASDYLFFRSLQIDFLQITNRAKENCNYNFQKENLYYVVPLAREGMSEMEGAV
jgi:hypothetical protein